MKIYPKGIIYLTICTHPDKKGMMYVGSHCLNNPDYLGSGGLLTHYIKILGRSYFKRYIIQECVHVTREQLVALETQWIQALGAEESPLFWNQRSKASGGYVIKDKNAHSVKTKVGMKKHGASVKISINATKPENIQKSKDKLKNRTPDQIRKAIESRSNNGSWLIGIKARNKQMVKDPAWLAAHCKGILNRDNFVQTPIGIFQNATKAGCAFMVSNTAILKKVNNPHETEWLLLPGQDHKLIDPDQIPSGQKREYCDAYFTKYNKIAHNKTSVFVLGIEYESKTSARKALQWSQGRLENYLKKELKNG
jgi:hypothetical protein